MPVVFTGLEERFQGTWDPSYFKRAYGHEKYNVVDCTSKKFPEVKVLLADFFESLEHPPVITTTCLKLKVSSSDPGFLGCLYPCFLTGLASDGVLRGQDEGFIQGLGVLRSHAPLRSSKRCS